MKFKFPFGFERLKKLNRTHLIITALAGILLLVIALPTEEGKKADKAEKTAGEKVEDTESYGERNAYRKSLELQLKKALSAMENVGQVEVMITLKDAGESVVEKDETRTDERTAEEDGQGTKRQNSVINSQEETIYIQSESNGSTPFVAKEVNPQVEGVLVVAQGAGSATVVKNISDAVMALFPVEVHKIKVVKMNE